MIDNEMYFMLKEIKNITRKGNFCSKFIHLQIHQICFTSNSAYRNFDSIRIVEMPRFQIIVIYTLTLVFLNHLCCSGFPPNFVVI